MTKESELVSLERNLFEATLAFRDAEKKEAAARREACDARQQLDAAQKQLDAYVAKLRNDAPTNSDWGSVRLHRFQVAREPSA